MMFRIVVATLVVAGVANAICSGGAKFDDETGAPCRTARQPSAASVRNNNGVVGVRASFCFFPFFCFFLFFFALSSLFVFQIRFRCKLLDRLKSKVRILFSRLKTVTTHQVTLQKKQQMSRQPFLRYDAYVSPR